MAAMPLRQKVMQYVDQLDDEQTLRVITFIETLHRSDAPLQNSKTLAERVAAEKALSELEGMTFSPKAETSMDGRAERAQALWRKYESLP